MVDDRHLPLDDDLGVVARRAQQGDRAARELLVQRLLPRTRNLVRYLVGSDAEVDDFAQNALIAVVRGLGTFAGTGTLNAWADRVVARSVFAELRRRNLRPGEPRGPRLVDSIDDHHGHQAPEGHDDYLARRWLARQLEGLSVEQRGALVLHFVLEMTVPEIALETGVPPETVRSRIRVAKQQLRASMGLTSNDGGDDE